MLEFTGILNDTGRLAVCAHREVHTQHIFGGLELTPSSE